MTRPQAASNLKAQETPKNDSLDIEDVVTAYTTTVALPQDFCTMLWSFAN